MKVLSGSKTLFGSRIVQCCAEESFGNLLSKLEGEAFAEKTVEVVKIIGEEPQQQKSSWMLPYNSAPTFAVTIASVLWYLDPHHPQFKDYSCEITGAFAKFQDYNNWKRKKEEKA